MRLWSQSWTDGQRIPPRHAAGRLNDKGSAVFSDDVNPHLAWDGVPPSTQSLALICHDPDVPSRGDDVGKADREVPASLPRVDFFHWVMIDLPPTLREIREGEFSSAFTPRGKSGPGTLHGARHGLNDFTGWFADDERLSGLYFGYDGPFPPGNDALVHRYVFMLYALSVPRLDVTGAFTGARIREALTPHVLEQASFSGTYTLNRRLAA